MIILENVYKSYGSKNIFKNFSLSIEGGEFAVVSGKSGSGKSTLLNLIGGLEEVDRGSIKINGLDISLRRNKLKYWRDICGFIFQNFILIEEKTVKANLEMVRKGSRSGLSIEEVLDKTGLSGMEKKRIYQLSGGEKQRVCLSRVLFKKANIILADEPTGSLDTENADNVIGILKEMNEQGKTIVLVTHDERFKNIGDKLINL